MCTRGEVISNSGTPLLDKASATLGTEGRHRHHPPSKPRASARPHFQAAWTPVRRHRKPPQNMAPARGLIITLWDL